MATCKGIAFPDPVAPLARHMHSVNDHREALAALSSTWDTLALLAHLSNLKADMTEVRASFSQLTTELLVCLAEETLKLANDDRSEGSGCGPTHADRSKDAPGPVPDPGLRSARPMPASREAR